jgi:DNA polymerase-3 subunit delta
MRLQASQLAAHLEKGLKPCYALVGDEPLALKESLDLLRSSLKQKGYSERQAFICDRYFDWKQIQTFAQSQSLFSSLRILELSIPNGKPGVEGWPVLAQIARDGLPDTVCIVMMPELDWRETKATAYQQFEQDSVFIPLLEVPPEQLPTWIAQRMAANQQSTDADTLKFLAQQVEGNLLAAHQEIEKLALMFPAGVIDGQAILAAVLNVSRFDENQLSEAIFNGDIARTSRMLNGLQEEGVAAIAVMNPLIWTLRPVLKVKQAEAQGMSQQTALAQAKLFGDRQQLAKRALSRYTLRQLQAALLKLADIDKMVKGILQGDPWLELDRLSIGLARIAARQSRTR